MTNEDEDIKKVKCQSLATTSPPTTPDWMGYKCIADVSPAFC